MAMFFQKNKFSEKCEIFGEPINGPRTVVCGKHWVRPWVHNSSPMAGQNKFLMFKGQIFKFLYIQMKKSKPNKQNFGLRGPD
jgi:hypothetical protein